MTTALRLTPLIGQPFGRCEKLWRLDRRIGNTKGVRSDSAAHVERPRNSSRCTPWTHPYAHWTDRKYSRRGGRHGTIAGPAYEKADQLLYPAGIQRRQAASVYYKDRQRRARTVRTSWLPTRYLNSTHEHQAAHLQHIGTTAGS